MFDIDGIYKSRNNRIWLVNHAEADTKDGIREILKFLHKIVVWLGACCKGLSPLVIFENGTVDHNRYNNKVLLVALKYGNSIFGNDSTFQQDGAEPHFHEKTEGCCANNFSSFIQRDHWAPNSSDLNPFDYCLWDELGKTIKWNRVASKKSLIMALKRAVKEILCLKVARLGPIDYIGCHKTREII